MRQRFYLCYGMLRESFVSPFAICGFLLAFTSVINGAFPYIRYAGSTTINVLEPFIILCSERSQVSLILFGYLILMCNAPFINARSEQALIRTTRIRWSDGMLMYIFIQSLLYYLFILLVTIIMAAPHGYFGNVWSRLMYGLSSFGSGVEKQIDLYIPDVTFLQMWSVQKAAIHSFLLLFLYSFLLALILFVGNLAMHWLAGSIIAVSVHFIGYMLISDSILGKINYSLLAHGILYYHDKSSSVNPTVSTSYMLFIFLIVLLCSLEHIVILHCDLRHSISERL